MLDADPARLTKLGAITIQRVNGKTEIAISGFEGQGTTCRDAVALATTWAIGELQRELMATLKKPGGGTAVIS